MNSYLISSTLLSLLNIAISAAFKWYYPKEINALIGYRTARSMKSQEAWLFANKYSSDFLFRSSVELFFIQFPFHVVFEGETALLVFLGCWILCLLAAILVTEIRLKRNRF
jgi:hypothetical protein